MDLDESVAEDARNGHFPENNVSVVKETDLAFAAVKVFGSTSFHSSSFVSDCNRNIFYLCGSFCVKYDIILRKQTQFYLANKTLTSLNISSDFGLLALGERGHQPSIIIKDVSTGKTVKELSKGHSFGISCLAFSSDGKLVISVGYKNDKQLIVWNIKDGTILTQQRISHKVYAISMFSSASDAYNFVTSGDRHIKFWSFKLANNELSGTPSSLPESLSKHVFLDVVCCKYNDTDQCYSVSSSGVLCRHSRIMRSVDELLNLEVSMACCIHEFSYNSQLSVQVKQAYLAVGCSDGIIHILDSETLVHIATIPYHEMQANENDDNKNNKSSKKTFNAVVAIAVITHEATSTLACVYSDRCIALYNLTDLSSISLLTSSSSAHGSCIWDLDILPTNNPSIVRFATCSSDGSVKLWNCHDIDVDVDNDNEIDTVTSLSISDQVSQESNLPNSELYPKRESETCLTCICHHPSGSHLMIGDKLGVIHVIDVELNVSMLDLLCHDSEVLCIAACSVQDMNGNVLIASGGRDRLIHTYHFSVIFPHLKLQSTLDCHSSSVTHLVFSPDGSRLISSSLDKSIAIHIITTETTTLLRSIKTPRGSVYGMAFSKSDNGKHLLTCGQDKKISVYNSQQLKMIRSYSTSQTRCFDLNKVDVDASGSYIVVCGVDKTVTLIDFFSGDIIGCGSGHGDIVVTVKFSYNGRYILSACADGVVIVWKCADWIVTKMDQRLDEVKDRPKMKEPVINQWAVMNDRLDLFGGQFQVNLPSSPFNNAMKKALTLCQDNDDDDVMLAEEDEGDCNLESSSLFLSLDPNNDINNDSNEQLEEEEEEEEVAPPVRSNISSVYGTCLESKSIEQVKTSDASEEGYIDDFDDANKQHIVLEDEEEEESVDDLVYRLQAIAEESIERLESLKSTQAVKSADILRKTLENVQTMLSKSLGSGIGFSCGTIDETEVLATSNNVMTSDTVHKMLEKYSDLLLERVLEKSGRN